MGKLIGVKAARGKFETPIALNRSGRVGNRGVLRACGDGGDIVVVINGAVGDDIDDAAGCVRAEQAPTGPDHDFDLADVINIDRDIVPGGARIVVEKHLPSINQNQQARLERLLISTHPDIENIEPRLQHVHARNILTDDFGNLAAARLADFVGGDDGHVRRRFADFLRRAGGAGRDWFAKQRFKRAVIDALRPRRCAIPARYGNGQIKVMAKRPFLILEFPELDLIS